MKFKIYFVVFVLISLVSFVQVNASVKVFDSLDNIKDDESGEILYSPASSTNYENYNFSPLKLEDTITLDLVSRAEWGCPDNDPNSPTYCYGPDWEPFLNPITNIVIHHTALEEASGDWAKSVRDVWKYHAETRGWKDIGYNYLIDPNGVIYEGRYGGEFVTAGHTYDHNVGTVGISMLGNYETRELSPEAEASLNKLLEYLLERYKLDVSSVYRDYMGTYAKTITGHRDWAVTACPGTNVYNEISPMRISLASIVNPRIDRKLDSSSCNLGEVEFQDQCIDTAGKTISTFTGRPNDIYEFGGNLYFSQTGSDAISKIDLTTNEVSKEMNVNAAPSSIAVKIENDMPTFYTTTYSTGQIYQSKNMFIGTTKIESSIPYASVGSGANDILIDSNGIIYTANSKSGNVSKVTAKNTSEILGDTEGYPIALAIDDFDNIYTANYLSHSVSKIDQDGNTTNFKLAGYLPIDIEIYNSKIYVLNEGSSTIEVLNLDGTRQYFIELPPFGNSISIFEDNAFVTHSYTNLLSKISLESGVVTVIPLRGDLPVGNYFDSENERSLIINANSNSVEEVVYDFSQIVPVQPELIITKIPVYRFWSPTLEKHFYTSKDEDYNAVLEKFSDTWEFEKIVFYVADKSLLQSAAVGTNDFHMVHRYYSSKLQSHFYTADESERADIDRLWADVWFYEGEEYLVNTEPLYSDNLPIYRFLNRFNGSHFYANPDEKFVVQSQWSDTWSYEKLSYYVFNSKE